MTLKLRSYRSDDREALLRLKCSVFPHLVLDNEQRRFEWQMDENPARTADLPQAVVLDGPSELAGYFAFVPYRVQMGREVRTGCTGIDLCLGADHRGAGESYRMVQTWLDAGFCAFAFATALGTTAAAHLLESCGAGHLGGRRETIAYAWFAAAHHPLLPEAPAHAVEEVDGFGAEVDELWERLRPHFRLVLVRDARYLNWRYRDFPFEKPRLLLARNAAGRVSGVGVLQVDREFQRSYLLELLAEPDDVPAMRGILRRAVQWGADSGEKILYYSTRHPAQVPVVLETGFQPVPGDVPTYMGKINYQPPDGPLQLTDWYTSLGDGDQLYNVGEP